MLEPFNFLQMGWKYILAKFFSEFINSEMQSACIEWEKILAEHPNDLMALKFAHDAYFFAGDKAGN
jgi:hypothetical protein